MNSSKESKYRVIKSENLEVMVEWLFFDLARCELQNVTVVDWKTKTAVGPFCGTETPPRYLSRNYFKN